MERPTPERVIIPYLGQRRTKKPRSFQGGEERRERGIARVLTMCRVFFQTSYKKKNNKVSRLVRAREKCEGARGDCATSFKGFSLLETWLYISTSSDQLRYRSLV